MYNERDRLFKLRLRTYLYASDLIDQVLPIIDPPRDKLQLLGIACHSIASQFVEVYSPEWNDYVYISDGSLSLDQIEGMGIDKGIMAITTISFYSQ